MRVGFIGLGHMGGALAERLLQHHQMWVYDLQPEAVARFVEKGATAAKTPGEVAAACEMVLTCLPTSDDVHDVIFSAGGLLEKLTPETLIADMTTGDPAKTRAMATELSAQGFTLIDAPVSGGPRGAIEGTIAIMVGASEPQFERARPIFEAISPNIFHAGTVGAGHAVKLGNNLLSLTSRLITFEVLSLLVKNGVAAQTAVEIIQKSSGRTYMTEVTMPEYILSGKMFQGFTMGLMRKDTSLALELGRASDIPMPIGNLARETLQSAINDLGEEADLSALALMYEKLTGVRIRP